MEEIIIFIQDGLVHSVFAPSKNFKVSIFDSDTSIHESEEEFQKWEREFEDAKRRSEKMFDIL